MEWIDFSEKDEELRCGYAETATRTLETRDPCRLHVAQTRHA